VNRACDYGDRHIVAVALTFATATSVALALLIAFSESRYGVAVSSLAFCASIAFYAFVATDDATARQRDAYWRARTRGIVATHDAQRAEWNTYCDQVAQRNEERYARLFAQLNEAREERDSLRTQLRATTETLRRMTRERDWLIESDETARLTYERDSVAHLALRLSGIDLPHGVTIQSASMRAFHIARGAFESCDDMTDADYIGARERLVAMAVESSPLDNA
jgi:hypothetical protein